MSSDVLLANTKNRELLVPWSMAPTSGPCLPLTILFSDAMAFQLECWAVANTKDALTRSEMKGPM